MNEVLLIAHLFLWVVVLFLGFLVMGLLRALGILRWQLEQLETTTPRRLGRDGLKPGTKAPDFTLPGLAEKEVSLADFAGRELLLVFTQTGCEPCHQIVPALNRIQQAGDLQVLAVTHGDLQAVGDWARETGALFPVAAQHDWNISRRYEVFATPFAFLIDERGIVQAKGIVTQEQHLRYLRSRKPGMKTAPRPEVVQVPEIAQVPVNAN
jgi:methylamine dehydrogenase accessory protein MauD